MVREASRQAGMSLVSLTALSDSVDFPVSRQIDVRECRVCPQPSQGRDLYGNPCQLIAEQL